MWGKGWFYLCLSIRRYPGLVRSGLACLEACFGRYYSGRSMHSDGTRAPIGAISILIPSTRTSSAWQGARRISRSRHLVSAGWNVRVSAATWIWSGGRRDIYVHHVGGWNVYYQLLFGPDAAHAAAFMFIVVISASVITSLGDKMSEYRLPPGLNTADMEAGSHIHGGDRPLWIHRYEHSQARVTMVLCNVCRFFK